MDAPQAPGRSPLKLALQSGAVLLVAALFGLLVWKIAARQKAEAKINRPAPGFTLQRIDKPGKLSLASLRGHPVILNFWASWCAPCRDEAATLEATWKRYRNRGLIVLGIDYQDLAGDARAFARKHGMTYPLIRYTEHVAAIYGLTGVPETFFVDRKGKLVGDHIAGGVNYPDERPKFDQSLREVLR
jgi:cytochrome c biogenesis protein CcmG/thiol:disulfide interchange protein DsbE